MVCVTHGAHIGMDVVDLEGACWEGLEAPVQARARACRPWAPSRAVIFPAGLQAPQGYCEFSSSCCLLTKSCPTLFRAVDCSPPGSSVCGISQARVLEWVAISFSTGSSRPRGLILFPALAGRFFTAKPQF